MGVQFPRCQFQPLANDDAAEMLILDSLLALPLALNHLSACPQML